MKISRQIFILMFLFISSTSLATNDKSDLSSQLNSFLEQQQSQIAEKGFRSDFNIGNIDPRFNEKPCTFPLEFSLNRSPMTQSNLTVLAECKDKTPWKLYITSKFSVYGDVVYAATTIPRGHSIQHSNLELKEEIINSHYHASFSSTGSVEGMIAKRSIRQGSVIQANLLQAPKLVKRGDDVVIVASSESIMIRMRGTAMQDGELGQQINVRNNQSARIVRARVSEAGLVNVTL